MLISPCFNELILSLKSLSDFLFTFSKNWFANVFYRTEILLSTFSLSNGTEYTESFPSETKIDLVLKNHTTTERKEVKNFPWAREQMWKVFPMMKKISLPWSSRTFTFSFLSFPERKFRSGEQDFIYFTRFSTFSTPSHHRAAVQLRSWCCDSLRMVGIIATNHSHKLKSFYGISTLLSAFDHTKIFHLPENEGKKLLTTHIRKKYTKEEYQKVELTKNSLLLHGREFWEAATVFLLFVFCLAFWGSHWLLCFLRFVLFKLRQTSCFIIRKLLLKRRKANNRWPFWLEEWRYFSPNTFVLVKSTMRCVRFPFGS